MAYAHKVNRYTFSGTSFGGQEIWSTSLYVGAEAADAIAPTQEGVDLIAAAWQTFFTAPLSKVSSVYSTTDVKGALINTDGKTDLDSVVHHSFGTPINGGTGDGPLPPQISLVTTLLSSASRGLASKGRMYLPGICVGINTSGHIVGGNLTPILENFKTFINAINTTSDAGGTVILASFGRKPPLVGGGVNRSVTTVRMGDVYDTQRRRRNAFVENYQSATL